MKIFATVLNQVDILLLTDVYAAGEAPIPGADSRSLCRTIRQRGKLDPIWVSDVENISSILAGVLTDNDLVLVQGAGNIGKIARRLAETKITTIFKRGLRRMFEQVNIIYGEMVKKK